MGRVSRWSSSLYFPMRNSDQMTTGKTHPTLHVGPIVLGTKNDLEIFIIFHLVVYILAQLDQNWLRWYHWLHLVVHHYQLVVDQDWFPWHLWQGSGIVLTHDLILEIEMKLCLIPSFSRVLKIKHDCFPRIELGFWRRIRFIDSRVIKWTIWLPIVRYTEFNIDYRLEQKYHAGSTNQ